MRTLGLALLMITLTSMAVSCQTTGEPFAHSRLRQADSRPSQLDQPVILAQTPDGGTGLKQRFQQFLWMKAEEPAPQSEGKTPRQSPVTTADGIVGRQSEPVVPQRAPPERLDSRSPAPFDRQQLPPARSIDERPVPDQKPSVASEFLARSLGRYRRDSAEQSAPAELSAPDLRTTEPAAEPSPFAPRWPFGRAEEPPAARTATRPDDDLPATPPASDDRSAETIDPVRIGAIQTDQEFEPGDVGAGDRPSPYYGAADVLPRSVTESAPAPDDAEPRDSAPGAIGRIASRLLPSNFRLSRDGDDAASEPNPLPADTRSTDGFTPRDAAVGVPDVIIDEGAFWEREVLKLTTVLETELNDAQPGMTAREQQEYIRRQVSLRMMQLISRQPQQALRAIPGIDPAEQEFWTQTMWGLVHSIDPDTDLSEEEQATAAAVQWEYALQHLRQRAGLQLVRPSFCHRIDGFGRFEQFGQDKFRPGQPVLIYTEVRNFTSRLTSDGQYRTLLKSTVEIDRGKETVHRQQFSPTEDLCKSLRTDYFHSYRIDLPTDLTPGSHVLRLTVEDLASGKSTVTELNFLVR